VQFTIKNTFLARTLNGFVPARSLIHASGDSLQGIPALNKTSSRVKTEHKSITYTFKKNKIDTSQVHINRLPMFNL